MRRRYSKARPSKTAHDTYRRLMGDNDSRRLEKGVFDQENLSAIDLASPPELDLEPPKMDFPHNTEKGDKAVSHNPGYFTRPMRLTLSIDLTQKQWTPR
ncbi:MAG: hypothetical protein ACQEXG_15915 [Pseudomonadota bacterium]